MDREDNPLRHAPHTAAVVCADTWPHKYARELAAYPVKSLRAAKYWVPVGRADNVYGDRNLFCSCVPARGVRIGAFGVERADVVHDHARHEVRGRIDLAHHARAVDEEHLEAVGELLGAGNGVGIHATLRSWPNPSRIGSSAPRDGAVRKCQSAPRRVAPERAA
jgi:hypothetical protein